MESIERMARELLLEGTLPADKGNILFFVKLLAFWTVSTLGSVGLGIYVGRTLGL